MAAVNLQKNFKIKTLDEVEAYLKAWVVEEHGESQFSLLREDTKVLALKVDRIALRIVQAKANHGYHEWIDKEGIILKSYNLLMEGKTAEGRSFKLHATVFHYSNDQGMTWGEAGLDGHSFVLEIKDRKFINTHIGILGLPTATVTIRDSWFCM